MVVSFEFGPDSLTGNFCNCCVVYAHAIAIVINLIITNVREPGPRARARFKKNGAHELVNIRMRMQTIAKVDSSQTSNQREIAVYLCICICIYVADISWRCVSFRIFSVDFSSYIRTNFSNIHISVDARARGTHTQTCTCTCAIITIDIIITVRRVRVLIY